MKFSISSILHNRIGDIALVNRKCPVGRIIKEKGYNYLCVSRRRLTDYELAEEAKAVTAMDCKGQPIRLSQVKHEDDGDYYLAIHS